MCERSRGQSDTLQQNGQGNRLRYSNDHPQTVTACRWSNINDARTGKASSGLRCVTKPINRRAREAAVWSGNSTVGVVLRNGLYVCMPSCRRYAATRTTVRIEPSVHIRRAFNGCVRGKCEISVPRGECSLIPFIRGEGGDNYTVPRAFD